MPGEFTLDEAAIAMHELFLALMKAGFTEDQALKVVGYGMKVHDD